MHSIRYTTLALAGIAACVFSASLYGMGLRSFVALPLDKGGAVVRFQFERNRDAGVSLGIANFAYGIGVKHTLLLGLPLRLSPGGSDRWGDLGLLYRYTTWQQDYAGGTRRFALLGGVVVPTDDGRDAAIQAGFVFTSVSGRNEWDIDALYLAGMGDRADSGRYDVSWQYRLFPRQYPEWGIATELNSVIELGGRWTEGNELVHQLTVGLQWIHPRWVLEGGVFQDINGPEELHFLLSTRFHF